ncbi:MAG: hypothetical protein WBZ36_14850 [Candidatus Nitrosopolaris sp.]
MVQKHIVISMIAPAAVAGILIMAILANQAFASSYSYNYKFRGHNDGTFYKTSYKCHGHYCKISKSTRNGNVGASNSVTTANAAQEAGTTGNAAEKGASNGNAAQEANNAGQGGPSGQPSGGNAVQGGPSTRTGHCKAAITTLGASWYPPYSLYQIRGKLTCGGSGLSGKTITLTSSKLSYVGKFGTAVTREDGYFSTNYRPGTAKPLTTVSAWYLGGPDEGGITSKVVTPQGGPQSNNNGNAAQGANNGNAAQGANNGILHKALLVVK